MILLRKKNVITHLYLEAQYHYTSLVGENVKGLGIEGNYWGNERKGGIMIYA